MVLATHRKFAVKSDHYFLEFFVLIADKWRVRLRGRNPDQDYIHASYAHVCYLNFFSHYLMRLLGCDF